MHAPPPPRVLDLRAVAHRERHPLIFTTLFALGPDEAMELVNDHDPLPLRARLEADFPAEYAWQDVERGPAVWRVRIARQAGAAPCCGACGGAG